jgi:hypothetical protein
MRIIRPTTSVSLAVLAAGIVVGLAMPAAAHQVSSVAHKINGGSIAKHSISGNRLKSNTVTGAQLKESTLATVPSARLAKTLPPLVWHTLTLANGWHSAYSERPVSYTVDAQGLIHLKGDLTCTSGCGTAFTMPAHLRPNIILFLPIATQAEHYGELQISTDGTMTPIDGAGASGAAAGTTMLDGVVYSVN